MKNLFCALSCLVAFPLLAGTQPDDVVIGSGKLWGTAELWQSGTIPGGPGVWIDTGNASRRIRLDETNRIVGKITSTAGSMPARGDLIITDTDEGFRNQNAIFPDGITPYSFHLTTNSLVFDNNGSPAEITIDDPFLPDNPSPGTTFFRHQYDVPIELKDDLQISQLFCHTNNDGRLQFFSGGGCEWGILFSGKISGEGKGITINNTAEMLGTAFASDENDFTGDITVQSGVLRALETAGLPREGTPFGRDNTIIATTGKGRVDIGGFQTGKGQILRIAGKHVYDSERRTNGVLYSSWAKPHTMAKWEGDVLLDGDAWIGGSLGESQYPMQTPGAFEISASIKDGTAPSALHLINPAPTVFSGNNTFSGGLYLDKGLFTARCPEAFGTGGIFIDKGVYRFTSANDADIFTADVRDVASKNLRVLIDQDVARTISSNVFAKVPDLKLFKFGPGTLIITNYFPIKDFSFFDQGKIIYDTSFSEFVKFGPGNNYGSINFITLCNDTTLVATGNPETPHTASWYGRPDNGAAATFRAEKNQKFYFVFDRCNFHGYVNLETDGSDAFFFSGTPDTDDHPYWKDYSSLFYEGESWVISTGRDAKSPLAPMPASSYANQWNNNPKDAVDVNATLAATPVTAGTVADVIRFNQPSGEEITLTLSGDLTLQGNTILMTANTGNTDIRITGGTLKSKEDLRLFNFNTNATLIVESDILSGNKNLTTGGPGKIEIRGAKSYSGTLHIVGGETILDTPEGIGTPSDGYGRVNLYNGGIFSTRGDFSFAAAESIANGCTFRIYSAGGAFKVENPNDRFYLSSRDSISIWPTAALSKKGPGTLEFQKLNLRSNYNNDLFRPYTTFAIEEGIVSHQDDNPQNHVMPFSEDSMHVLVKSGAQLLGRAWVYPPTPGANGGGAGCDLQGRITVEFESGKSTVDICGKNLKLTNNGSQGVDRSSEFFAGTGELILTNSSTTPAICEPNGYRDCLFHGTFTSYVPIKGGAGLQFPNAELHIPKGITNLFTSVLERRKNVQFGRLSGDGRIEVKTCTMTTPGCFYLGMDRDPRPVADFPGEMQVIYEHPTHAIPRLVKIGDNAQRISGGANLFQGNSTIRKGSLLVGNDSPATPGASGALGETMVYVGDSQTEENTVPSLLIDGPFTVANEIRVLPDSPASAIPTVGGTENADGASFTGPIKLYRDVALSAGAGATVTFAGPITSEQGNYNLTKAGEGTVLVKPEAIEGMSGLTLSEGTLQVDGPLVIPEGTTYSLGKHVDLCTKENRMREYTVLKADSIEGTFTPAETLPLGWHVVTKATSCVLRYGDPPTIILLQ